MFQSFSFTVEVAGERLDVAIQAYLGNRVDMVSGPDVSCADIVSLDDLPASRSQIAHWIEGGHVLVDEKIITKAGLRLKVGQIIGVTIPTPVPIALEADESVVFSIVYEDEDLAVLDKPAGLVVHPGAGVSHGTLVHGLLARIGDSLKGVGDELRPGIVHRLDKETSGLMVVAKSAPAHRALAAQFKPPRQISRTYVALVRNLPRIEGASKSGTISLPIGRHPVDRKRMAIAKTGGREAVTHWRVCEEYRCGYLLELVLETGRTHQIRVHLHAVGAPIVGDPEYGEALGNIPMALRGSVGEFGRQALHAHKLTFVHPRTGKELSFEAPLPEDMVSLIDSFKSDAR